MEAQVDRFRDPEELARLLGDDLSGPGALYRQLATALASAVGAGLLVAGDRLPSERDLAHTLHVSRATVVAAYDELRGRGVVESRQGSGTRIAAPADREPAAVTRRLQRGLSTAAVRRFDGAAEGLISMRYALEPGDPRIASALMDVVEEDLPTLLDEVGYAPRGLPSLRAAIADHHTSSGLPTRPDEVLVTTGTHQALALVSQLLLERGAMVAVESPSWPGCFDTFSGLGARLVGVPMDDDGLRADRLGELVAAGQVAALFVMPTFHNPTGTLMSAVRRRDVARVAAEAGVPVVEDLAYSTTLTHTGALPPPIAASAPAGARVLTLGSLSKALWAGLRVGWIRAGADEIEQLGHLKASADMGTPLIDQALAARLVPDLATLGADRTAVALERLEHATTLLRTHLPDWTWRVPAGGTALWIRLPGYDAARFAQVALRHGVEVTPGRETDPTGAWDDHLRLPFTFEPALMSEAVRRLAGAAAETTGAARP
jgi:DNA-binding transcriptional MocR family regulator